MSVGTTAFDAKKNLIVNYLPNSLSQEEVKSMFQHIGKVKNCKLMRDTVTGTSLGYAFVEYLNEDGAARAINQINGIEMQDKVIKVSYARQSTPEIKNANVYVAGLPDWVLEDKLHALFTPFGTILTHKVLTNPDGTSRGAGFVRFSLNSEAEYAIKQMAGKALPDAKGLLTVKLALPPASKYQDSQCLSLISTNPIAGVGAMHHSSNVRFNPLGVTPPTINAMSSIAAALAQSGEVMINASVYVFGLNEKHTELNLYELFSPFGAILNVKLIRDLRKEDRPCKGYGFVNYINSADAARAVATLNGAEYEQKILQVSIKQNNKTTDAVHIKEY